VADLHVLEDLGRSQRGHAERPADRRDAEHQEASTRDRAAARDADDPADVRRIALAEIGHDFLADGVELRPERGDLFSCHCVILPSVDQTSSTRSERAREMQSWTCSPGSEDTTPVRRFSTVPLSFTHWQVRQMPIRHP
jgi:hypothetical protein